MQFTKTRIAPTPSGYLHLGNMLSFAITAAWAERTGASILLRIDDLDHDRTTPAYLQDIFDTLHFMEIPWHEGPRNVQEFEAEWSQVHRMRLYRNALDELKAKGLLFACSCSRSLLGQYGNTGYPGICAQKQLPLEKEEVSWRLNTGNEHALMIDHITGNKITTVLPEPMRDFIVRKKDGYPAYQLTSLIDDLHFGVDLIVRGEDLLHSTLAQHYLAASLQQSAFREARFLHHALMMNADGQKLSKSAGDTSILYLRKKGYTSGDVYTMIARKMGIKETVHNWQSLAAQYERLQQPA